jgi:anti-sigma B factor antagonist
MRRTPPLETNFQVRTVSDRPPEPFRCEVEPARDHVNIIPHGELDLATAPELDQRLRELCEAGFSRLILDLRHVTFMDSTGLRLILDYDDHARRDGIAFELRPAPPGVERLFEITGVLDRLSFTDP